MRHSAQGNPVCYLDSSHSNVKISLVHLANFQKKLLSAGAIARRRQSCESPSRDAEEVEDEKREATVSLDVGKEVRVGTTATAALLKWVQFTQGKETTSSWL